MRTCSLSLGLLLLTGGAFAQEKAAVGKSAPDFTLKDADGKEHKLADLKGKVVVLEWFNPDCPAVKKHHVSSKTMKETAEKFADKGVVWLAINSGAEGKQGAGPERNRKAREDYAMPYPVLLDMDGKTGRAYGAMVTPTMVVIDKEGKVAYWGAIDDQKAGGTNYVARAVQALLDGQSVPEPTTTKGYG